MKRKENSIRFDTNQQEITGGFSFIENVIKRKIISETLGGVSRAVRSHIEHLFNLGTFFSLNAVVDYLQYVN